MEVKLVARIIGAEERTTSRETFWREMERLHVRGAATKPESELDRIEAEERLYRELPRRLLARIDEHAHDQRHRLIANVAAPFRRRSILGDQLLISVKAVRYASLEILLELVAGAEFPLSADEVVQALHLYAPRELQDLLGPAPLAVTVADATGSLQQGAAGGTGRGDAMSRAYLLANFSLVVPVLLTLAIGYIVFHAMVAQMQAVSQERQLLFQGMNDRAGRADADRAQLMRDALELVRENRANTTELQRLMLELRSMPLRNERRDPTGGTPMGPGGDSGSGSSGGGRRSEGSGDSPRPPPGTKPLLTTGDFTIFGTGPELDFGQLAKSVVEASATAGPKQLREVIQAVGDGVDVAKKGVDLTSSLADLYRKLWPERPATPPSNGNVLPAGVLLDRRVNFAFNSAALDPSFRDDLRKLAEKLRADRTIVLIEGHADAVGNSERNERLSRSRADSVRSFLIEQGVDADQLNAHGYGEGYLWFPYAPDDGANRRVRIIECRVAGEDRCQRPSATHLGARPRPAS